MFDPHARRTVEAHREGRALAFAVGFIAIASLTVAVPALAGPVDPAIVYQGRLTDGGQPAHGAYEMYVDVYNAQTGGNFVSSAGSAANPLAVEVTDGLFTVELNLHVGQTYNGNERWLQIRVRRPGQAQYTTLQPRQRLAPAPFANLALSALQASEAAFANDIPQAWKAFTFIPGVGPVYNGSGHVGIGTDTPQARLHVNATASEAVRVTSSSTIGTWLNLYNGTADQYWRLIATGSANGEGPGVLLIGHGTAPTVQSSVMTMTATGNVGIGTTAPAARLDVNGTMRSKVVQITGGSDVAEPYDIAAAGEVAAEPGMVVSIDPARLGALRVCDRACDPAVAGIVSGANGIRPGLTLTQEGTVADGALPVASIGRVWCWVDAGAGGPVGRASRAPAPAPHCSRPSMLRPPKQPSRG